MSTPYGGWSGKGKSIDYSVYGEPDIAYYREPSNPSNAIDKAELTTDNSDYYSDFTIAFVAKLNSIPNGTYGRIFECYKEKVVLGGGMYSGTGKFEFNLNSTWLLEGNNAESWDIPFGKTVSMLITRANGILNIYQNNELKFTKSVTTSTMSIASNTWLNHGSTPNRSFDSNVYSLRIYNKSLTESERTAHYEADKKYFGVN